MNLFAQKHFIREKALEKRLQENRTITEKKSKIICRKLESLKTFKEAKYVLFYMPIKGEVNTLPLIKKFLKKKKILLPKTKTEIDMDARLISDLHDLENDKYNFPAPKNSCRKISKKEIDAIIVPGIAFSPTGLRLGFGKGYYDKFLKNLKCPKIGLAYNFQIHENIPAGLHDQKMDFIITESKIYNI